MSTKKTEHLSAVFDDEAGDFEQQRLLDEMVKDFELRQTWSRMSLVSEVMKEARSPLNHSTQQPTLISDTTFLDGIRQQLEEESVQDEFEKATAANHDVNSSNLPSWVKPASTFAAIAAITAASIVGLQTLTQSPGSTSMNQLASVTSNTKQIDSQTNKVIKDQTQQGKAQKPPLERYLASHFENAGRTTITPYIRTVSYRY